ncbi:sodium/calcium exchanger 2 isoform X2 [Nematostella vectensis]|uniref:sodium/calcium exchanger 2 isoform X2 n=1 Tax=Nematostella vectensis TaxID=45351 RepID=UPI0013901655|nr:sodium/calcium exchanger 2 isoform X2 [Nematostella vectensis]
MAYRTNFSRGYVVEYSPPCFESWLLLPAENLWNDGIRGFLYILGMLYLFLGIAIVADIFMSCIEVITSKKRKVTRYDHEKGESVEIEVFVWNETVANLTLMALGSSAPEILLAVVETGQELALGQTTATDGLGTFTIVGSASFNLLLITAVCVVSVPNGTVKRIREFGVFVVTAVWSMFAYVWMLFVIQWNSPEVIELWEAFMTLAFFPLLVLTAWCTDHGWWCRNRGKILSVDPPQVRVLGFTDAPSSHAMIHRSMELRALEQHRGSVSEKDLRNLTKSRDKLRDVVTLWRGQKPDENSNQTAEHVVLALQHLKQSQAQPQNAATTRLRFRHAALRSVTRSKKLIKINEGEDVEGQKALNVLTRSFVGSRLLNAPDDNLNRFVFGTSSYSVLKSAKHIDLEIILLQNNNNNKKSQGLVSALPAPYDPVTPIDDARFGKLNVPTMTPVNETNGAIPVHKSKEMIYAHNDSIADTISENSFEDGVTPSSPGSSQRFSVDYETHDGSAKNGKEYQTVKGTMAFRAGINKHILRIPILPCEDFSKNKDFYVLLKNPSPEGITDLGEPNLTRITIIDDDMPGEFSFEQASYHANFVTGEATCTVVRRKGCDGTVTLKYHTMNGTAKGGTKNELEAKTCDYEQVTDGLLTFHHGEMSKHITVKINTETQDTNFVVLLHDPSTGARIGNRTATVVHISSDVDDIVDRVANIITSQDEQSLSKTWRSQFEDAMIIQGDEDKDGNELPLNSIDFIMHFLTFFWKVLFAFIPPRPLLGGWPAFVVSLLFIAALTAVIEQLGKLLGCVVDLRNSVTGITIIAIGTSLPDTMASRSAALQDTGADAAIGNITGSNSVNVFLGLGLPWVMSTCYHAARGTVYKVSSGNLAFSVLVFALCGGVCLFLLVLRRYLYKGELGGPTLSKWMTGLLLLFLWFIYVVLSSLMAYGHISGSL